MKEILLSLASRLGNFLLTLGGERKEHDRRVAKEAGELLSEPHLVSAIEQIDSQNAIWRDRLREIDAFIDYLALETNKYLNPLLKAKVASMLEDYNRLSEFIGKHFFIPDTDKEGRRLKLYPDLENYWRKSETERIEFLEEKSEELYQLARAFEESYLSYIRTVKQVLFV